MDTSEAGVALRSHTLARCDEGGKGPVGVGCGKSERDVRAGLRDSEVVFAAVL